jgi:hypothetical protein
MIVGSGIKVGAGITIANDYVPSVVTNGLQLYLDSRNSTSWPGSGTTWYDLSGNGKHATFYKNPTATAVGSGPGVVEGTVIDGSTLINNGELYFNGTSSSAQYQYAAGPNLGTNVLTWTINCWFKANSLVSTGELPAIFTGIYTGYNAGSPFGQSVNYCLQFYNGVGNDNKLYGGFYNPGSWQIVPTGQTINTGTWYNGVVTYDGATINFYINNSLVSTKTNIYTTTLVSGLGYHVARRWDGYDSFDGYVPVTMMYNRALSTSELTQNFNYYRSRYGV